MLLAGRAPRIAPLVLIPGKQHHAGMPSPHQGERAFVVPRAVTAFTQLFAPMIAVLTLVSGAEQSAIGGTPHGRIRLPGIAVDVRLAESAAGWPRRRSRASAHSGA
jgi:hypothetical protein